MSQNWRYFGRTAGGPSIFEIFRFPADGRDLEHQDWAKYPEWLQPDGLWVYIPDDVTICNEQVTGQFDERTDEITREEVDELHARWLSQGWPGRPRKS